MKTLKFKLYRSEKNKHLHHQIDISGVIWNHCIALHRRYFKLTGKYINVYAMQKHIAKLKKLPKYDFWNLVDAQSIQDICQRVDRSYQLFFKYKAGKIAQRFARPGFRKVKKYTSFTLKQTGWKLIGSNKIRIRGKVYKFSKSREILGTVKTVTVKRNPLGELFICFAVETEQEEVNRLGNTIVGADFGLKTFLTLSNGEEITSSESFKTNLKDLRKASRAMSWKIKGSANWHKAKDNLNRVHARIANQRRDWFFKLAHDLTDCFDIIVLETLNIKAMHRLWGRKVGDIAFSEFRDVLQYIAAGKGKLVHFIDRFYPSSKTCSCCGHINQDLTLNDRRWRCPSCKTVIDRDANAAVNILREGASSLGLGDVRPASLAIPV
ncbi:MAG: transposase [Caldilinea sp. CFX5]|nr:transposase [Caldilinea sp. CFX5]